MPYTLSPLPYDYNALEPYIDEQTMRLNHDKHHQAYYMELRKIPYIYVQTPDSNWGFNWQKFKVTPDTKLVIDGKSNTVGHFMNSKQHLTFRQLKLENREVTVNLTNVHGDLDSTGNNVQLKFRF